MRQLKRITVDPRVVGGKPCIRNLRVTVGTIVDMNLPPRWVPVLKAEGWDAVHWSSVGSPGAADAEFFDTRGMAAMRF
jgi:hypothetical protein